MPPATYRSGGPKARGPASLALLLAIMLCTGACLGACAPEPGQDRWREAQLLVEEREERRERLISKLQRAREGMQQWEAEGRDLGAATPMMREVEQLFGRGLPIEGEAKLDELLALLESGGT